MEKRCEWHLLLNCFESTWGNLILPKVTKINEDMAVGNGLFYVKGKIRMLLRTTKMSLEFHRLPGEAVCVCSFQCGLSRHGQLCEQRLCVCVCVYFLLCISLPRVCLRAVPTWLIPLILGQAALYRQVSLSLNLAGQKTLFLHSQGCWERLTGIGCVFLHN